MAYGQHFEHNLQNNFEAGFFFNLVLLQTKHTSERKIFKDYNFLTESTETISTQKLCSLFV